jgi:outer membrane receptor for ferrienterochelin and colicin
MTIRIFTFPLLRMSALSIIACAAAVVSGAISANEQMPSILDEASTIIYPASFFQPYNPVSVNDMIDRIPGVSLSSGGGGRGLGSGGDLLINGQRLAGKDNSPRDQLSRISAREVERIEIIRGTSGDLAVRGSSQVVNIVLQESRTRASTSVEVNSDLHSDGTIQPGAAISHSRQSGNLNMMFNVLADPQYRQEKRLETTFQPDLTPIQTMRERNVRDRMAYRGSALFGYQLDQQRMQLNVLYGSSDHPANVQRSYAHPDNPAVLQRAEREAFDYRQDKWEVGGDYEYTFNNNSRAMVLFIVNEDNNNYTRERFDIDTPQQPAQARKSLYIGSDSRTRERIVQSAYSWSLTDGQDMRLGIERAQTILDAALLVGRDSGNGEPSAQFGGLQPALGVSNLGSTVAEMRYEGFAVHNWAMNDRMSVETSLLYETSEISQSGSVSKSRQFNFFKPSVDYRFNINSALQLRATVGKEVQQLSFANFSATANTSDNNRDADAGNPDLVPTQETRYELALEYRLPDDNGVLSSRFFIRDIADQIGRVNATTNPMNPISAAGNIGDAKRWGVYLDGSTRLGLLGMPDALISSSLYLFDSQVTDAILGTTERINGRGRFNLGFRHDITRLNLNYGFDYAMPFNGGRRLIEINSIDWNHDPESLTLFVSTVVLDDVTVRLESNNTLGSESCRNRVRYQGATTTGQIRSLEKACWSSGQKVALKVRTTF